MDYMVYRLTTDIIHRKIDFLLRNNFDIVARQIDYISSPRVKRGPFVNLSD